MPKGIGSNITLVLIIGVSLFGSLTTIMVALHPPAEQNDFFWRKPLIGSLFTLICISGIVAASFPRKCSKTLHLPRTEKPTISEVDTPNSRERSLTFKGHHPDCGRFSAHVLHVGKHIFCAACTGLLLGAFISIIGAILYFFGGCDFGQLGFSAVLIGQVGIFLGFIQFKFKSYARLTLNAFFVLATFLTLAEIDKLAENLSIELYFVLLIIFWLSTRILISQWDHWRICHACKLSCELK